MALARHTWKCYGIDLNTLKYGMTLDGFLDQEEMMRGDRDYEYAMQKDYESNNKQP